MTHEIDSKDEDGFVVRTPDPHFSSLFRDEEDSLSWLPHHGSHGLRTCRFPFPLVFPPSLTLHQRFIATMDSGSLHMLVRCSLKRLSTHKWG